MAKTSESEVDLEWIKKSADLSRLRFSTEEISEVAPQLAQILNYIDQLKGVSAEKSDPWVHPLLELLPDSPLTVFRKDAVDRSEETRALAERILAAAPQVNERSFQVPEAVPQATSRPK